MKQKRFTNTDIDNLKTENFLYKRFRLLALNMFKWTGLEALGIEERHIEGWLFDEGRALVFEDKDYGLMCLPCDMFGANVLNDPTHYRATGFNYSKMLPVEDGVLIENNKLRMPTADAIRYFTDQLYEIVRTRDTNIKTLKLPFVMACTDKDVLTGKKILEEVENNAWAVFTNKNIINIDEFIKVLQTGVKPFTAELTDQYHDIMNEALTYLGINNANTDKRERLITDEANANNQFIESCAEMFLEARKRACEEINKRFGTNISVELRNKPEEVTNASYNVQKPTTRE